MNNNHKFKLQYRPSAIETYLNYQQPNAEVEGKESVLTPNGILSKFEGPSHAQGGIDVNLPPKSLIFSTKLKLPASIVEELIGVKKAMSPADLTKKFPTKNYMEVLADPNSSKLKKDTSDYMLKKNLASLYSIFQAQQDYKDSKGIKDGVLLDDQNPKAKYGMYTQYQTKGITPNKNNATERLKSKFNWDENFDISQPYHINVGTEVIKRPSNFVQSSDSWDPKYKYWLENKNEEGVATYPYNMLSEEQQKKVQEPSFPKPGTPESQENIAIQYANLPDIKDTSDAAKLLRERTTLRYLAIPGEKNLKDDRSMIPQGFNIKTNQWENITGDSNFDNYSDFNILNYHEGYLPGNEAKNKYGEPNISNQGIPVLDTRFILEREPLLPIAPLERKKAEIPNPPKVEIKTPEAKVVEEATTPKTKYHYRDIEDAIGIGGALSRLMENNIKLPYYNNTNLTYIPTRYEQVNTLQPERSLDAAKQAIMSSNLPESVKQARLAEMSSNALEAANKIQIQNTQGDVQNDNRNIAAYVDTYNKNQALRNQANAQYTKESQIAQGQYEDIRNQNFDVIGNILKNRNRDKFKLAMYNAMNPMYEFDINGNLIKFNPKARTEDESVWFDKSKNQIMSLADSYIEKYKMDPKEAVTAATNFYKSRKSDENNTN